MNLGMKTSIGRYKTTVVTTEMIDALNGLHEELKKDRTGTMEVFIRSSNSFWVCAKKEDMRELYVVLPKVDISLDDVDGISFVHSNIHIIFINS